MIFELSSITRMAAMYERYRSDPVTWANDFLRAARPVLLVCRFDGDVSVLFEGLDAIDRALHQNARGGRAILSPLESARDAEVQRLALQVSGILTRSLAATEQAHDEEAVQNGGTTTIEAKLGESVRKTGRLVAVGALPEHGGSR